MTEEEALAWAEERADLWAFDCAEAVVDTLKRRSIHVSEAHHHFITSCTYPPTLEFWYRRANFVSSVEELTVGTLLDMPIPYTYKTRFAHRYMQHGWLLAWEGGRVEGSNQAQAEAILQVLDARGISISGRDRLRLAACVDPTRLVHWLNCAATAENADQVFP